MTVNGRFGVKFRLADYTGPTDPLRRIHAERDRILEAARMQRQTRLQSAA